jgi:broad specificity phosphatase PhoE
MSKLLMLLVGAVLAILPSAVVVSQPAAPSQGLLDKLRLGGYVIVLRHGATNSEVAGKDPMSNPNWRSIVERQLNEEGRAQATEIGKSLRDLGIPVSAVVTSPAQRAIDTGRLLGFGKVSTDPDLAEAGPAVSPDQNSRRADALRELVGLHKAADGNLVIVTHKPNLVEAFGNEWSGVREGEASVFEPDFAGAGYRLVARVPADQWGRLARASLDAPGEEVCSPGVRQAYSPHFD